MTNTNELIFVNKILNAELTIRKAARRLGLRRDDLIKRIREIIKNDEENLEKLNLIIITNKILFDNLSIKDAANLFHITEKDLDKKIINIISKNPDKIKRYEEYKNNIKGK